ncbi:TetR/AcrR family transcriptional regulator [Desulfatibacillum aliphaticivorans]|uniref:Transcriptional regulator, TetR family n=1 Tax=Desulfatibacillum aliphaticivorans TaxID=218208 RepID=B8FIB7_DESAL|nr:TetR/AcrR family transcriptional regulator [Desulfatibacillum aliphaticivorans]ACL02684.1 transcriptional regulator, TetR family [Desulfatibacillum aliphaticivorans]
MATQELTKAERTRRFIIETAAPIFNKKGFAGTSLSDVTEAAGLTKGSIYGNFKNKDELAMQVFDYNVNLVEQAFTDQMAGARTSIEKLMGYPLAYRKLFNTLVGNGGCPLINTLVEADDTHEKLLKKALDIIAHWKETIAGIVEKGIVRGEIRRGVNPERIAELMITLFEGGGILSKAAGDRSYFLTSLDHVESIIQSLDVNYIA